MTIYYVAPNGSDGGEGTLGEPFGSLQHAHDIAKPGDTIYLRGGTYKLGTGLHLTSDGTKAAPIAIENYPGEKPVLDGYGIKQTGQKGWVLDLDNVSYNHIKGIEIKGGAEGGVMIRGASSSNIIEQLDVHHNGRLSQWEGKGFALLGSGSNNLLLNNDSHDNRDIPGDNADGFQVASTGSGNVLRGNRAWGNSDDGFDLFNVNDNTKAAPVVLEDNWAFSNGYDENGKPLGDGNGFKIGGSRPETSSTSGGNILTGNVAWDNRANGFDENNSSSPNKLYNNTAYDNGGYNYGFWEQKNVFEGNISYGTGKLATSGTSQHNSWDIGANLTASDFASLNDSDARDSRASDGSLPDTPFLHPTASGKVASMGLGPDQGGSASPSDVAQNDPPTQPGSSSGGASGTGSSSGGSVGTGQSTTDHASGSDGSSTAPAPVPKPVSGQVASSHDFSWSWNDLIGSHSRAAGAEAPTRVADPDQKFVFPNWSSRSDSTSNHSDTGHLDGDSSLDAAVGDNSHVGVVDHQNSPVDVTDDFHSHTTHHAIISFFHNDYLM